jgi:hypothetical protein
MGVVFVEEDFGIFIPACCEKSKKVHKIDCHDTMVITKDREYSWRILEADAKRLNDEDIRGYIGLAFSQKFGKEVGAKVAQTLIIKRGK